MEHQKIKELISSFYDEELNGEKKKEVEEHIKQCPECRKELEEILEEWILFRVYKNLEIPPINNIEIKIKKQAVA